MKEWIQPDSSLLIAMDIEFLSSRPTTTSASPDDLDKQALSDEVSEAELKIACNTALGSLLSTGAHSDFAFEVSSSWLHSFQF